MRNILLTISYCGKNYHGWQIQENANTVQNEIQKAAAAIFGKSPDIKGCSRTDSGVHARMFCLNFRTDSAIPTERIPDAFNHFLPSDIVAYDAQEKDDVFHARYSCLGKEYEYVILNSRYDDPFLDKLAYRHPRNIDTEMLDAAAKKFIGTYDFSAFCASGSSVEDHVRTIYRAGVRREGDKVVFSVRGNGFLYNMVRIMAGTLLMINDNKISPEDIPMIISTEDRKNAGPTAPPEGLYLNKVFYIPEDLYD